MAIIFGAALLAFLALALLVRLNASDALDAGVHAFTATHRNDALDAFFRGYTGLGQWFVLAAATAVAVAALSASARSREAVFLLATMTVSLLLNLALKYAFARGRPPVDQALVHAGGYSFPSGHAMSSATLALTLILIAWPTRWRVPATMLAAVFAALTGISRIYLGVHWLTDVLAGWAMAVVVVTGTGLVMGAVLDKRTPTMRQTGAR